MITHADFMIRERVLSTSVSSECLNRTRPQKVAPAATGGKTKNIDTQHVTTKTRRPTQQNKTIKNKHHTTAQGISAFIFHPEVERGSL